MKRSRSFGFIRWIIRWGARAALVLGCLVLLAGILPSTAYAFSRFTFENSICGVLKEGNLNHIMTNRNCFELTSDGVLVECPYHCNEKPAEAYINTPCFLMITPEKHTLGMNIEGELFRWTPGAEACWTYIKTIDDVAEVYEEHTEGEVQYHADETTIYEQVYNPDNYTMDINCYDIASGEKKHLFTSQKYGFGPGAIHPDGGLVIEDYQNGFTKFVRFTPDGERSTVCETAFFPEQLYGLVSDDADGWYMNTENAVYHLDGQGEMKTVNLFSRMQFAWGHVMTYLPENEAVVFGCGDATVLNLSPLYMEERHILSINGKTDRIGSAFSLLPYESRHLNVSVELRDSLFEFDDLAQALNTGNLEDDLFVVSTYDDGLYRMKDKRYFYDLSADPELAAYVDSLCPAWREAVTTPDGKIAALPLMAEGYYRLCYRGSLWEELDLGEVPRTWDEMLDTLQRWYDDGILQDVRLFSSGNTFRQLALQLLKNNAARYAARGETPRYQDEALLRLLNRLLDMRPMLDEYDGWNVYGDYLLRSDVGYGLQFSPDSVFSDLLDLPLGMDGPDDYAYLMDLYAFIINPRCQQPELALQFLRETLHDRHPSQEWKLVQPGEELGLINQAVLDSIAASEETIAQVQAIYDQTDDPASRDVLLQAYIQPAERGLAAYADERTHWYVTPEADLFYRNVMAHLAINTASGYRLMWENASSAINAFLDGKTGPEAMVRKLDEVVRMWEMENQ